MWFHCQRIRVHFVLFDKSCALYLLQFTEGIFHRFQRIKSSDGVMSFNSKKHHGFPITLGKENTSDVKCLPGVFFRCCHSCSSETGSNQVQSNLQWVYKPTFLYVQICSGNVQDVLLSLFGVASSCSFLSAVQHICKCMSINIELWTESRLW